MRGASAHAGPSVLVIGNHAPPYGGIQTHIASLAPYLAGRGWSVRVLAPSRRIAPAEQIGGYTVMKRSAVTRTGVARTALRHPSLLGTDPGAFVTDAREMARALGLFRAALSIARQHPIDVIAAYHLLPAGLAGAWLSASVGAALVTTFFGEIISRPRYFQRRTATVRLIAAGSAKLLSCSRHCAGTLASLLGIDAPVDVVYHGADVERLARTDGQPLRQALGVRAADRLVLFVGRMVPEMGLGTLLTAAPGILAESDVHLLIAGASGTLTEEAHALARRYPGRVSVRPDLSYDDRDAAYAAADILVAPSTNGRACLGVALIEAMAAGTAVVGCRVGGTAEIITDGVDGLLVPPSYPDGLTLAVRRLVRDRGLAARLAEAGRERARHFASDATNRRMESVLLDAIAHSRPGDLATERA